MPQLLRRAMIELTDATALLDHYANGRTLNWDGSTKSQALATIKRANALIAEIRATLATAN